MSEHSDDHVSLKKYEYLSVGRAKFVSTKKNGFKLGCEGRENNEIEQVYN